MFVVVVIVVVVVVVVVDCCSMLQVPRSPSQIQEDSVSRWPHQLGENSFCPAALQSCQDGHLLRSAALVGSRDLPPQQQGGRSREEGGREEEGREDGGGEGGGREEEGRRKGGGREETFILRCMMACL